MNLFKVILVLFAIYFVRRVYQFYKFAKLQQELLRDQLRSSPPPKQSDKSIEAEYKVID